MGERIKEVLVLASFPMTPEHLAKRAQQQDEVVPDPGVESKKRAIREMIYGGVGASAE